MQKIIFILLAATLQFSLQAQKLTPFMSSSPALHQVKPDFAKESAVVLEDVRVHQYVREDPKKEMQIVTYNRKLIKVLDAKGVEMFNKIYLPVSRSAEISNIKARTILPGGKIIDITADKILDEEDEGRLYKKFAMEGMETGCEVEYSYETKRSLSFFGLETFYNGPVPAEVVAFSLITPSYLSFTVKGYNGLKKIADTTTGDYHTTTVAGTGIKGLFDEKYSNKDANIANVQYKLSYNLSKNAGERLFTWDELANNVYTNYTDISDKEYKSVEGFLKQSGIRESMSEEEKIVQLEDYIKSTIKSDEEGIGEDANKIERIIKTNVSSNEGLNKLFVACLEKLKIPYKLVFPSKRSDLPLDKDLENYRLVNEIVLYFPGSKKFLEPANVSLRYPYIDPYWAATTGLFINGTTEGKIKYATASFNNIPIQPVETNAHNMAVSLRFNPALDSLELHSSQILLGYGAAFYRPAFAFTPKDKLEDLTKSIINSVAQSENIRNMKVRNEAMTDGFTGKELIIEGDITTASLLEMAGKKLLVKIGEVIGPQVEMYQEKPRQLPISIEYPHNLDRDITFIIPDGYQVKNPGDLNFNITDKAESGRETMGFISSYEMKGNEMKIKVHEFYTVTDYPVSMFSAFTKVINASADFNKVVLVLEKK